jgi:hypothetical protein
MDEEPYIALPPEDATIDSLWAEILALKEEIRKLKKVKRGVRPKVEDAVKILVTDPKLNLLPIAVVADLICQVFKLYGMKCNCSENSVRWYISQKGLEWDIVRRQLPPTNIAEAINATSRSSEESS